MILSAVAAVRPPAILSRYLVGEFLRILALSVTGFVILYVIVDFFDRFDDFLKHQASLSAILRYFVFKVPLIVTQVTPIAVLASLLLSLGGLSRHNELTAMQACGVGTVQVVAPLLATCIALSVLTLAWNEAVVPNFNRRARYINTVEIKKRELPTIFGTSELWSHGKDAFYNVKALDPANRALVGLTLYRLDSEFNLKEVMEVPIARWDGREWSFEKGIRRRFAPDGQIEAEALGAGVLGLRETPTELLAARREAEEFNGFALRNVIASLREKGLDATEYRVDLHLKLAVPFISVVMALIAIPIGVRNLRTSSLAANVGTGLVIGFSYWVVLALTVSLGHSGALPPVLAAWSANAIFTGIGAFFLLGHA
ncbi:MAG: lipopolysaccharide export system permease protein [Candidatus Binatota bacterium]|jgi:lipopolysaccharide export system permease protein|nr:lipopolysaccharide export system permease protein [Candidatus Binatota bacterium]